jgi:hypothetical protein
VGAQLAWWELCETHLGLPLDRARSRADAALSPKAALAALRGFFGDGPPAGSDAPDDLLLVALTGGGPRHKIDADDGAPWALRGGGVALADVLAAWRASRAAARGALLVLLVAWPRCGAWAPALRRAGVPDVAIQARRAAGGPRAARAR